MAYGFLAFQMVLFYSALPYIIVLAYSKGLQVIGILLCLMYVGISTMIFNLIYKDLKD